MKIQKQIIALALGTAMLLPLSCKKGFLDLKDTKTASSDALFKTPSDGIQLVNAIYDTFDNVDFMKKAMWYQANFLTQDFKNYGGDVFFTTYEVPTSFDPLNTFWVRSYQGIARANAAFPIIAKMKADGVLTPALADRLTGEAYFLRGVFYYYMACEFGGVPLELKTVTGSGRNPRATQDEVFASVASDMSTAAGLLTWKEDLPATEIGRATKGAAYAYAGSALMWLKKYGDALTSFKMVDTHYQLMENYLDIHEYNKQNNKESIFEVQFKVPDGGDQSWGHSNDSNWLGSFGIPEEISQTGYDYADPIYFNSFETGDSRRRATVIGPGETHPSPNIQISSYQQVINGFAKGDPKYIGDDNKIINTCGTVSKPWKGGDKLRSGYYEVKYWRDPALSGYSSTAAGKQNIFGDQNAIFLRYGEVLLSEAECKFRMNDEQGALDLVKLVRNRAWGKLAGSNAVVPAPPAAGNTLYVILDEYRHELGGEFSVWFNLRRSGEHIKYVKQKYNVNVPAGKDLMPIPQLVIATNETIKQNPGY
ncbi:RagB/SusD family nutrient uptake outer membrane protein [Pedobacter changchengzhani]|uniref:RagB/SusD family nutrient uptake outer membrane protein n=1 Tax=Pedobacter changchengzhani TaxID=2529274 RepID=A0A4R5MIZ7_9SPHI|nr:RagB/SusD family nutrient uptake outer membrane protein [Pedobacter changchengzhani]TDG35356.1 RagB/SusD family nutrient uptake outer membrane protein [Pedobacter changchengzhani]